MNVSNNVITYTPPIKLDTLKQSSGNVEFKKALDDNSLQSQDSTNQVAYKTTSNDESSDKTETGYTDNVTTKDASNVAKTTTTSDGSVKASDNSDVPNNLSAKINDVIKKIIDLLKQNIDGTTKEQVAVDNDKSTDAMAQIQQLLQSLSSMLQSINKATVTKTSATELSSIDPKNIVKSNLSEIKNSDKSTDGMDKIQQLLQSLSSMLQSINKDTVTKTPAAELSSIDSKQQLATDPKNTVKSNLSEIVALLQKSKGNNEVSTQILVDIQKLTEQIKDLQGDSSVVKVSSTQGGSENIGEKSIKDNLTKMIMKQSTETTSEISSKDSKQSSSNSKNDNTSSGNSSTDDKFLKSLLSGDKEDTKISKAVSFMNQFETVKTTDTTKVQNTDLVISKDNVAADVIKSVKFMELNNIKDLTVKMNPKDLGEITIKLTMESGTMKASLSAQNKDTYNLLNQNIQDISDRLKNMDIKIQSLDISLYEDSTFFSKDSNGNNNNNNGKQDNNSKTSGVIDDDIAISDNYSTEDNQVNEFV